MKLDFTFEQEITKDDILNNLSEEAIFCRYMGIDNITKKLYRSVIREDNKPTCAFFRGKTGILYIKDFATGDCLNCFALVMRIYNCNYYDALKQIANDFNIIANGTSLNKAAIYKCNTFKPKADTIIQVEIQKFTPTDLAWWAKYGVTEEILKKYKVYSCKHVFLNNRLFAMYTDENPIYGYYFGKQNGKELWKIYMPHRKQYRFINNLDAKRLQGFKQLPEKGNLLVITKSQKDIMTLSSLGIPAIAPNSEHLFVSKEVLESLKKRFKHIVVLYDNDTTGIRQLVKIRKEFPELNYVFLPKNTHKDISDFYKAEGKVKTAKIIKQYLLWLKKHLKT